MRTDGLKSQKEPFKLIFPSKDTFNGPEPLLEYLFVKEGLTTSFGGLPVSFVGIDIGRHPCIEYLLTISSTIINTIKAYNGFAKKHSNRFGEGF